MLKWELEYKPSKPGCIKDFFPQEEGDREGLQREHGVGSEPFVDGRGYKSSMLVRRGAFSLRRGLRAEHLGKRCSFLGFLKLFSV